MKNINEQIEETTTTDHINERWASVLGYEGLYEVSDCGRVKNAEGKILKPQPYGGQREYRAVGLSRHSKQKTTGIHRLVAECFVGLPTKHNPDGTPMRTAPEINHKDGNPANNYYTNLEWCDRYYNNSHRVSSAGWNYTHRTKDTGRKKSEHSPEYYEKQVNLYQNKIHKLERSILLLQSGVNLTDTDCKHKKEWIDKKILSIRAEIVELSKKLNIFREHSVVYINRGV